MKNNNRFFNINGNRGSITLFVLIAMLFFLAVGMTIFVSTMNKSSAQEKDLKRIQQQYNNVDDLNAVYERQRQN